MPKLLYKGYEIKPLRACRFMGGFEVRLLRDGGFIPLKHFRFHPGRSRSRAKALAKAKAFIDHRTMLTPMQIDSERAQIRAWMLWPQ